jgi:hypothetical protein
MYHFCIYIHVYTCLHHIHPPAPFSATSLLLPVLTAHASTTEPDLPFVLQFCRRKNIKDKDKEIKIATQGVSLCCFHACMYYSSR